jgi:hypothetical protein
MAETKVTPEVLWAQRSSNVDAEKNFVYLTINVPDVPKGNIKLDLKPTGLSFEGRSDTLKKTYHVELEFFAEIDPAESKTSHTARDVELKLRKKELGETYWPRLLKDSKKAHFLKTDFDKWVDEDEQNEAPEDDFGANFGGPGGPGGMGGMGGLPGMGTYSATLDLDKGADEGGVVDATSQIHSHPRDLFPSYMQTC